MPWIRSAPQLHHGIKKERRPANMDVVKFCFSFFKHDIFVADIQPVYHNVPGTTTLLYNLIDFVSGPIMQENS
jgi:hypothetical protein